MNSNAIRAGVSIPGAIVVTLALFWLMNYLITHGIPAIQEQIRGAAIDFIRVDRDETVQAKDRQLPDRPDKPESPPPPPPMSLDAATAPNSGGIGINAPAMSANLNLGRQNLTAPNDGDAIPLVRVPPQYPQRAASRGIEGWVQLEFIITETGAVEEPTIIAAEPPNIFNRSAIRALQRWKYKPRIVDGRPVRRHNNQVVITFELEDS